MIWIKIEGDPTRQFYNGSEPEAMDKKFATHRLLLSVEQIRFDVAIGDVSENANMAIELDNKNGAVSAMFKDRPPIGAMLTVFDDAAVKFQGVVASIFLDQSARLQVLA